MRGRGQSGLKARRGVRGRHGSRGWPARCARMAGSGGDTCGASSRAGREEEQRRLTGAPGLGKKKKLSLKFKTKVFPDSKIHKIFTGSR